MMNGVIGVGPSMASDFEVLSQPASGASVMNYTNGGVSAENIHPVLNTQISLTDMTLDEARQKLIEFATENSELQRYMKDNNEMMKRQYETLAEWKNKVQQANIANKERFEQTKGIISTLRKENDGFVEKITRLERDLQEQYHENEGLKRQTQQSERQMDELKQTLSSLEKMKNQAEETGEPVPDMETVLIKLSLEKEKEFEEMRTMQDKRNAELQESRLVNESLLNDLKELQKLKEQIQQDYQRVSRENMELSHRMEAGLTLNSLNSVNWLHVTKKRGSNEEAMDEGCEREQPSEVCVEHVQVSAAEMESQKNVEVLQQSAIDNLMKKHENTKQEYEEQISQLQKTIQEHQTKMEELTRFSQMKQREIQDLKTQHERELAKSSKLYEDKMSEFARKLDKDREEQLKLQTSANENVESLKAQVINLMKEVHELNSKIEAANNSIDRKNARIKEFEEKYNRTIQNLMKVEEDKNIVINSLQTRCNYLQANYTQEHEQYEINKNELGSLRQSFNRLIDDYKDLLQSFDSYKASQDQTSLEEVNKLKNEVNKLTCQVIVAEEVLTLRDENVTELRKEISVLKQEYEEKLAIFKAQADVFRLDFDAERLAREKQAQEKNNIMQEMSDLQIQNQQLLDEMEKYSRQQLTEMQQRSMAQPSHSYYHVNTGNSRNQSGLSSHGYDYPSGSSFPNSSNEMPVRFQQPSEQLNPVELEFTCPKCNVHCPDLDTLQIHVVECMELD